MLDVALMSLVWAIAVAPTANPTLASMVTHHRNRRERLLF